MSLRRQLSAAPTSPPSVSMLFVVGMPDRTDALITRSYAIRPCFGILTTACAALSNRRKAGTTLQSRRRHALPYLGFIPIDLCRVEMAKPCVQRCRDHAQHIGPRHSVGAEAKRRDGGAIRGDKLHEYVSR